MLKVPIGSTTLWSFSSGHYSYSFLVVLDRLWRALQAVVTLEERVRHCYGSVCNYGVVCDCGCICCRWCRHNSFDARTKGDIAALTTTYLQVLYVTGFAMAIGPVIDAALIGMGNTVLPLILQTVVLCNACLTYIFIFYLEWGCGRCGAWNDHRPGMRCYCGTLVSRADDRVTAEAFWISARSSQNHTHWSTAGNGNGHVCVCVLGLACDICI